MSKPFDAMLNSLIDDHLQDWGLYLSRKLNRPFGTVQALDTDLAKNLQADRLFLIQAPQPYCIHLELESSSRLGIPQELLRYNVLAFDVAKTDVISVIMLLRPKAQASDLSGRYSRGVLDQPGYLRFDYRVIRVWEESIQAVLNPIGLAPLCLLTDEAYQNEESALKQLVGELQGKQLPPALMKSLLNSTYVLAGLRYAEERLAKLFEDFTMTLEDSTTYQAILRKGLQQGMQQGMQQGLLEGEQSGQIAEARKTLLKLGAKRFGPPSDTARNTIETLTDLNRLDQMLDLLLDANGWEEILRAE